MYVLFTATAGDKVNQSEEASALSGSTERKRKRASARGGKRERGGAAEQVEQQTKLGFFMLLSTTQYVATYIYAHKQV